MGRVMIYFSNGCKADFDADKVIMFDSTHDDPIRLSPYANKYFLASEFSKKDDVLINWDHVCFVRNIEEKEDE